MIEQPATQPTAAPAKVEKPAQAAKAAKSDTDGEATDRLPTTLDELKETKGGFVAFHFLTGFAFDEMPFYAGWSGSKARLQSKPIRWLFCDEVRNDPPGRLEMALKRTRSFWNSRRFLISAAGTKGDAMDTALRAGDQRIWNFECPASHHFQPLKFDQLKWDSNDVTKPEGKWRFDALAETVRFECAGCGHRIKDTPVDRRWIESHGQFLPQNLNAPRSRGSATHGTLSCRTGSSGGRSWKNSWPPWTPCGSRATSSRCSRSSPKPSANRAISTDGW